MAFSLLDSRDEIAVAAVEAGDRTPKAMARVREKRQAAAKAAMATAPLGPFVKSLKKRPARVDIDKASARIKREVAKALDECAGDLGAWLRKVAAYDPDKAIRNYLTLLEYQVPKKVRTELDANMKVAVAHFVAVEAREARPEMIDVTSTKVGP